MAIEFPGDRSFNQGIWIDIFPLDSLPPFADKQHQLDFDIARVMFLATVHPDIIENAFQKNKHNIFVDSDTLREFMSLPYKQRGIKLEELLAEKFFMSEHVGDLRDWCIINKERSYKSNDFRDVVYLPFEKIEIPAPVGYESVLTDFYGDWHKLIFSPGHLCFYSAEISWDEYLQKTALR